VLDSRRFERPAMNDDIFSIGFRTNEAITSGTMKYLYDAGRHAYSFSHDLQSPCSISFGSS
jgi:hypothetical protein